MSRSRTARVLRSAALLVALATSTTAALAVPATAHGAPVDPTTGRITYTIDRPADPTPDEADALARIDAAMAPAVALYNAHSDLVKELHVSYAPWVETADGSDNGSIRFGAGRQYMTERTALHEIAHTVGIGTFWQFDQLCRGGWTGVRGLALIRSWEGPGAGIGCGGSHFWPYGLNYEDEMSPGAAVRHVELTTAMVHDMVDPTTAPVVTTTTLPAARVGSAYAAVVDATGEPRPTLTLTSGTLPDGLGFDPATGTISGTPTAAGTSTVTVTAANGVGSGATQTLTLQVETAVPSRAPTGAVTSVVAVPGGVRVTGSATQADSAAPTTVQVRVDGAQRTAVAASGPGGAFTATATAASGTRRVCVVATGAGTAPTADLGCRTVTVLGSDPIGHLDDATTSSRRITAVGWAIDGDTTDPVTVQVTLDGKRATSATANAVRRDLARAFPGYGTAHGWSVRVGATPGKHRLCVVAVSTGSGADTALGCRTVIVPR